MHDVPQKVLAWIEPILEQDDEVTHGRVGTAAHTVLRHRRRGRLQPFELEDVDEQLAGVGQDRLPGQAEEVDVAAAVCGLCRLKSTDMLRKVLWGAGRHR